MTGSYQAETVLGEIVNIVEKVGGGTGVQVLVADDGTRYVQDPDQNHRLTLEAPAEGEDGVEDATPSFEDINRWGSAPSGTASA